MVVSLTDAELVLLGLVAERPRHGYELETVIVDRGVREWTALGFSSIYYILNKLESRGLVSSARPGGQQRSRRIYSLTSAGTAACVEGTRAALERVPPAHAPVLIGMANSPLLPPGQLAESLRCRRAGVAARVESMDVARAAQEPLATFVGAIFDHGTAMLRAELAWIDNTLLVIEGGHDADVRHQEAAQGALRPGDRCLRDRRGAAPRLSHGRRPR